MLSLLLALPVVAFAQLSIEESSLYTPYDYNCPASNSSLYSTVGTNDLIRENFDISQDEFSWMRGRQVKTHQNLIEFLDGLNMTDYRNVSFANYLDSLNQSNINIGLSFSGGAFRALLTGAGEISALDSRSDNSSALSGLLDSSAYISGLSGGAILLSTLIFQNWTSVDEIAYGNNSIWNMTASPVSTDLSFWETLLKEVSLKKKMGYEISLVDIYGRILSRYMFEKNQDNYGINALWSDIQNIDAFVNYDMPFPMIVASGGVDTNMSDFSYNAFEINPFEFGSWSPYVGGFVPIELMGSVLDNGSPVNKSSCTYDFDNVGFLVGSSSNILAPFLPVIKAVLAGKINLDTVISSLGLNAGNASISTTEIKLLLNLINPNVDEVLFGVLDNPFYNYTLSNNESDFVDYETLYLADGGLFEEVIPMDPFLVPSRELDIVFAFDNSGQTEDNWPNGTCLFATEERWLMSYPNDTFYQLPSDPEEFVELGLNIAPVFFGCNGSDLITEEYHPDATANFTYMKPLLVYIPNTNISYMSNISSFIVPYGERDALIENGWDIAQGGEDFAECVGCAIIRRSEERLGLDPSPACAKCFDKYCYAPSKLDDIFNVTAAVSGELTPTSIMSASSLPSSLIKWKSTRSAAYASKTSSLFEAKMTKA